MKQNYIAFSLWGNKEIYTAGAIKNAELAKDIYKDWKVIIFFDDTVPLDILERLKSLDVILKDMSKSKLYGPFWRFLAVELPDAGYVIFRDTDSRLSIREQLAVNEWINKGNVLHVMRDHPAHYIPFGADEMSILAGMWGLKAGEIQMCTMIEEFCTDKDDYYGIDQRFFQNISTMPHRGQPHYCRMVHWMHTKQEWLVYGWCIPAVLPKHIQRAY